MIKTQFFFAFLLALLIGQFHFNLRVNLAVGLTINLGNSAAKSLFREVVVSFSRYFL